MRDIVIAITAASYSGNKGATAMLQSSIKQLYDIYGHRLNINLMSTYPMEDKKQVPHDFVKVISCKPEALVFIAFPLSILYIMLKWIRPVGYLIEKNEIIKAFKNSDLVIDEAGVSFVDNRGLIMNIYAFICAAVPMLVGTPVVKYSQALGTFNSIINRTLAKIILPKCKLICARGQITLANLKEIGIEKNVILCADGAFTMEDSIYWNQKISKITEEDEFYKNNVVGLSISSVVEKKCIKLNIDYKKVMIEFINYLNKEDYHVLLIANAARMNSNKTRNNDLIVCDSVYEGITNQDMVRWYHKEMDAEEIRAYIGKCRVLVASRFHAMIGGLEQKVPVLLIGWSHKYQEVLDMFHLGRFTIDFSELQFDTLKKEFENFMEHENEIKQKILDNLETVQTSSRLNIEYVNKILNDIEINSKKKAGLLNINNPDIYLGEHIACRMGYSSDEVIRRNAASGGMVTALLCHLLETNQIDGAWVTKSVIENGKLNYSTYIATTTDGIKDCSSSIYMDMPLLKHINLVKEFQGKVAVVLTPCLMRALTIIMEEDIALKDKIVLKLSLYCSGNHLQRATLLPLEKLGISLQNANRIYYRRGHWRGMSTVVYQDGTEKSLSYTKTICAYKNAYFFAKNPCMTCQDHFGKTSDISFGDIWLKEMKNNPIKHTSCIIRKKRALVMYQSAVKAGTIIDKHISNAEIVHSQKRALVFKYNCAKAKVAYYNKQGKSIPIDISAKCKWNHKLAYYLANKNNEYSKNYYDRLKKIPMPLIYYYMCFIRVLLSF